MRWPIRGCGKLWPKVGSAVIIQVIIVSIKGIVMDVVIVFGALGGAARGIVGYTKYYTSYKNVKFDWRYFGSMIGVSAAVGLAVVWALRESGISLVEGTSFTINPSLALIIGYAGGDAIENLYKIILKKPVLSLTKK